MKMSEEAKRKISLALTGRKKSKETILRMKMARVGFKHSEESKLKIKEARKRQVFTIEHREAISRAMLAIGNRPPSHLGKKRTDETKLKMSLALKGNKNSFGKKRSEETRKKIGIAHSGPKCTFWRGGVSTENQKIRKSYLYEDWRKKVFERDDFTCVFCKKRGGKLNADHIKPFSTHPDLRFSLENGRTLCVPCHQTTETYGGRMKKFLNRENKV